MRYHAFADDVNVYLHDLHDYKIIADAIREFEVVSNSKVSADKSRLIGFHRSFAKFSQSVLPYPMSHIRSEQAKYLGIPIQGVDWTYFISKLPFMTRKQGYLQLDLISRALGTNIFVSSKTVYKDLVQCMAKQELRKMDFTIQKMFPGISAQKLYARPKKGGYGLIELSTQLMGHRAGVLASALEEGDEWYTKYLRLKMLHHMAKIQTKDESIKVQDLVYLSPADFLLEQSGRFFDQLHWKFSENEIQYFEAWKKVVPRARVIEERTSTVRYEVTSLEQLITATPLLDDPERKIIGRNEFKSLSRKKQEKLPPIMPSRFTEICPATGITKRWKTFWKELHKLEWLRRKDLTALHLFHFGSYVPMFDLTGNTRLMKCHLCSYSVPKNGILSHTYNSCESSKFWWQEIGFAQPMNLNEMLAPADTSYENLRKLNWFVKTVKRVYSRRRRESLEGSDPVPLSPRELKKALGETLPLGQ